MSGTMATEGEFPVEPGFPDSSPKERVAQAQQSPLPAKKSSFPPALSPGGCRWQPSLLDIICANKSRPPINRLHFAHRCHAEMQWHFPGGI